MNELIRSDEWPHVLFQTTLPDGRQAHIVPLTFGRARITVVNQHNDLCYDDLW